ncbi:hypothetical protein ACN6K9_006655 [Streptomyces sp. SAS_267]|uniref:hypothetical protein n=1 Tax=unclassified Streptomyces TaxID=2593676 RepID=UPI0036F8A76C
MGGEAILDRAGPRDARIVAGGGLDEYAVDDLVRSGAPIDMYAVGTRGGVSAGAPYLDSECKTVEYDGRPVMKLSSAMVTAPGPSKCSPSRCADVIALADERPPDGGTALLETVTENRRRIVGQPPSEDCRAGRAADLGTLPAAARQIRAPLAPRATTSERLRVRGATAARGAGRRAGQASDR